MLDFVPLTRSQNTECLQAVRSCLQINLGIFPRCRRCSAEPSCSSPTEDIWESALHRMAYLKWIMRNRCVASHSVFWIIWGGFVSAFPSLTTWCHSSRTDAGVLLACCWRAEATACFTRCLLIDACAAPILQRMPLRIDVNRRDLCSKERTSTQWTTS